MTTAEGHITAYWAIATYDPLWTPEKRAGKGGLSVWDVNYVVGESFLVVLPFSLNEAKQWEEGEPFVAANASKEERVYAEEHWGEILEKLKAERPKAI